MKKGILIVLVVALITYAMTTSCNTPAQKLENAEENVKEANKELDDAARENQAYMDDILKYREERADRIEYNEQLIADYKLRIQNEKAEIRDSYLRKISELEQKNIEMKNRLKTYKIEGREKWELFKIEFNRDMDELGIAFENLTVKSAKQI